MIRKRGLPNKSQITIFVILAIIIVAAVVLFFVLRMEDTEEDLPQEFRQVHQGFLDCLENGVESGISIMGEQGGYIYLPNYEPGNNFMPQGSQLNFMGTAVPYWYYISRDGSVGEQIPSKSDMEEQLEMYLEENLYCDLSEFRRQGYTIDMGEISARVQIMDNDVRADLNADLNMKYEDKAVLVREHTREVESNLGSNYEVARDVFFRQRDEAFLENYTLDTLHNYAPVTGVELSCAPEVWLEGNIREELLEGIESNVMMLRDGGYEDELEYFNLDLGVKNVNFMYNRDWVTKMEIHDEDEVLEAEPIGNQHGMGALGMCYTPYHFVYDLSHPVMVQIYDGQELFQFPVVVFINRNKIREAFPERVHERKEPEVCKYMDADVNVYTYGYGRDLEPIEADVSVKCFNEVCGLGNSEMVEGEALFSGKAPRCINGAIIAEADGYEREEKQVSTNEGGEFNVIMDKLYDLDVRLLVDGREVDDRAMVYFENDQVGTLAWPDQKEIKLSEGRYNISVQVYSDSDLYVKGETTTRCFDVARPGVLGMFGATSEECFDMEIPGQEATNVISGGGESSIYITQSQLESGEMEIRVSSIDEPSNIEDLQESYSKLEMQEVHLNFR